MIKSPFKAIVICVLLDKKISKNPAFPADMITQGGTALTNNKGNCDITFAVPFNNYNYTIVGMHSGGSVAITTELYTARDKNKTTVMLRGANNGYGERYAIRYFCAGV